LSPGLIHTKIKASLAIPSLALLLSACQPADPVPSACDQPPEERVAYLLGQYIDPSFALTRDSVACLSGGQEVNLAFGIGSKALKAPLLSGASFILPGGSLPGGSPSHQPSATVYFEFGYSSPPSELRVGRYEWLDQQADNFAQFPQVRVILDLGWPSRNPAGNLQSDAEQGPDAYFEITRLDPHPANEQWVVVTGRFTVRLFGQPDQFTQARPSILLRQVQFRTAVVRPEVVYRKL
jgi:hypothetical protein